MSRRTFKAARNRYLPGAASLALAALPAQAFAQTGPAPAPAQEEAAAPAATQDGDEAVQSDTLSDVIVTARRREESLQRTPVSISQLSGSDLQQRSVDDLLDLGTFIPNLSVGGGGTGPSVAAFALRGIGSVRSGIEDEAPVAVYVDGVYLGSADGALLQVIEPRRIEVLRGPQGTLFGKNALGGAIQYVSQEPRSEFGGRFRATYGRLDRIDVSGFVDVPLSDTLATRVTGAIFTRDGTVRSLQTGIDSNDINTRFLRGDILWRPSSSFSARLYADLTTIHTNGDGNVLVGVNPADSRVTRYRNSGRNLALDLVTDPYTNNSASRTFRDQKVWGIGLDLNWEIAEGLRLRSISSYRSNVMSALTDRDATRYQFFEQLEDRSQHQFSQELQLLGDHLDGRLNWIVGAYYFRERPQNSRVRLEEIETGGLPLDEFFRERNSSKAVFGEATFDLSQMFSVTVGGRYTSEHKNTYATSQRRGSPTIQIGQGEDTFNNFSPRVVFQAQWTPEIMTYASYSRGFRSGGFNNRYNAALPNNGFLPYDAETLTNYELGLRSDLIDRHLRFNLTYFHAEYRNLQLASFFGATPTAYTQNAGAGRVDGVELEGTAIFSRHFRIDYGGAYLNARYTDLANAQGITLNTPFARAPKWSYNLGAQFDHEIGGDYSIMARVDYGYKARQALVPVDDQNIFQPGFGLMNARVELTLPGDRFRVALFVTNLTGELYYTTAQRNRGLDMVTLGDPREWGISLTGNF
jgi:iron complex outermembrane receptor protein